MAARQLGFEPHSQAQETALFFETAIGLLACGIQFGKTKVGSVWMKLQAHRFTDQTDNFLIVAPTYKILTQSTLPPFLQIMIGYGTYSKAEMLFKVAGGGTIFFRSATDADSVVGITNIRAIWGDEAGLFSLYFSENIAARAAFRNAQTLYTTSPYTLNWLYKDIIRPKTKDRAARPDVTLIQAASWENPYFPRDVIERNKLTMDDRRFRALFGGEWHRPAGIVYDCYDDEENQCEAMGLPAGTVFRGGIDWGFTEPFVFKVRGITPEGMHYGVSEFYKTGLIADQICEAVIQRVRLYGIDIIYAPPDRPEMIAALQAAISKAGLRCAVVTADNSKRIGIDRHYELLKTRRLKYFRGMNPHTLDEIETYHYPEPTELEADDDAKEELPVEQNDHAMDADRYISIMTWNAHALRAPFVPGDAAKTEDQFKRIERLKRRPRMGGTENWG